MWKWAARGVGLRGGAGLQGRANRRPALYSRLRPVGPVQCRVTTPVAGAVRAARCVPAARCASPHALRRCVYFFVLACSECAPVTCPRFRHMRLTDSSQCAMAHSRRIAHVATPPSQRCCSTVREVSWP
jgi:hypothetical protein